MLWKELYKIGTKKIIVAGILLVLFYMLFWFWVATLGGEMVIEDGRAYMRGEAVARDKELTQNYNGALTREKVQEIWNKYGKSLDYSIYAVEVDPVLGIATEEYYHNYLKDFVSRYFFDAEYMDQDYIAYTPREEEMTERFVDPDLYFGYVGNWKWFWDCFLMCVVPISVLIIMGVAPIFSEDYVLHSADIILTTQNGRSRLYWVRLAAAAVYASLLYWGFLGLQVVMHGMVYGWEGLQVSTIFTDVINFYQKESLGISIMTLFLCGYAATLTLTFMVTAISARSRKSFEAVCWSLFLYLVPFIVGVIMLGGMGNTVIVRLLRWIAFCFPFLFPVRFMQLPWSIRLYVSLVLAALLLFAVIYGHRKYCTHQVN